MEVKDILKNTKQEMKKSLEFTKKQLDKVRTGRASTSLVDGVKVNYYGAPTPLTQVASLSAPDARTIVIQPWDKSVIADIEKAILQADLGFNPQNDGNVIRIPVPPLTEERRKEFVKRSKEIAEEGKIAVRNIRRDNIEILREEEKQSAISEDELRNGEDDIQNITDDFTAQIDELQDNKEKELMED